MLKRLVLIIVVVVLLLAAFNQLSYIDEGKYQLLKYSQKFAGEAKEFKLNRELSKKYNTQGGIGTRLSFKGDSILTEEMVKWINEQSIANTTPKTYTSKAPRFYALGIDITNYVYQNMDKTYTDMIVNDEVGASKNKKLDYYKKLNSFYNSSRYRDYPKDAQWGDGLPTILTDYTVDKIVGEPLTNCFICAQSHALTFVTGKKVSPIFVQIYASLKGASQESAYVLNNLPKIVEEINNGKLKQGDLKLELKIVQAADSSQVDKIKEFLKKDNTAVLMYQEQDIYSEYSYLHPAEHWIVAIENYKLEQNIVKISHSGVISSENDTLIDLDYALSPGKNIRIIYLGREGSLNGIF